MAPPLQTLTDMLDTLNLRCCVEKAFLFDVVSKTYLATDSSPVDLAMYELCSDMLDVVIDVSCIYSQSEGYDPKSSCIIRLSTGMVLYLSEVGPYMALVCCMWELSFDKRGLIDYNLQMFKETVEKVFAGPEAAAAVGSGTWQHQKLIGGTEDAASRGEGSGPSNTAAQYYSRGQ